MTNQFRLQIPHAHRDQRMAPIVAETNFLLDSSTTLARVTGLEPATSGVTGRRSNQLSYTRVAVGAV
jgi:hypothetical protein